VSPILDRRVQHATRYPGRPRNVRQKLWVEGTGPVGVGIESGDDCNGETAHGLLNLLQQKGRLGFGPRSPQAHFHIVRAAGGRPQRSQRGRARQVGHVTDGNAYPQWPGGTGSYLLNNAGKMGAQGAFSRILDVQDVGATGDGISGFIGAYDADQKLH